MTYTTIMLISAITITTIININNSQNNVYGAVIMTKPLREFTPFI